MLLNPKKVNNQNQYDKRSPYSMDPFDSPIPGQSLTDEPGKWPWDTPPKFTNVDDAFEHIIFKIDANPELEDDLDKFLMIGTPVESIVNTIAFTGFANGDWSPDIAELLKFPLSAYFAVRAKDQGFDLVMFNKQDNPTVTDETILEGLKENNPEAHADLIESLIEDVDVAQQELFTEEEEAGSFLNMPATEAEAEPVPEEAMLMIEEGGMG